jgi:hypothetical protein
MIRLKDMLSELLDPTTGEQYELQGPKTSSFTFNDRSTEKSYVWTYKNRKGNKMDITITFETEEGGKNPKMILAFGVANKDTLSKYGKMTGAGDLKTILSTVVGAAEQVIDKELGGDKQSLAAVGFEPSDERRERIYRYYIDKNFSQFKPEPFDSQILRDLGLNPHFNWYVNQNYSKLKEIGTATSKGVPDPADIGAGSYEFTTDSGNRYEVEIYRKVKRVDGQPTYNMAFDVSFYVIDSLRYVPQNTKLVNDPKNLYKVMAAVIKALQKEAVKQQAEGYTIDSVRFYAAKEHASDDRRKKLYMQYVKRLMPPGSEVIEDSSEYVTINLPDGYRFTIEKPKDAETK